MGRSKDVALPLAIKLSKYERCQITEIIAWSSSVMFLRKDQFPSE